MRCAERANCIREASLERVAQALRRGSGYCEEYPEHCFDRAVMRPAMGYRRCEIGVSAPPAQCDSHRAFDATLIVQRTRGDIPRSQ